MSDSLGSGLSRRGFLWSAAGLVVAGGLAACSAGSTGGGNAAAAPNGGGGGGAKKRSGPFKIAVANGYTGNTWRTQFLADLQTKAAEYKDKGWISEFTLVSSPDDINLQLSQINDLILKKPDAILIAPTSGAAAQTASAKIRAAGILPMIIDDPAPTKSALNVVPDNAIWFATQTEWLAQQLGGKGNVVQVTGLPGNPSDTARVQAAKQVLKKYPGIKIVASVPGYWDEGKARQAMATVLSTHHQIDGVLEQDIMGLGVIQAFRAANTPLPKAMTGDYTAGFLKEWKSLPNLVTMGMPYTPTDGSDAMGFAIRLLQGKTIKPEFLTANEIDSSITKNTVRLPLTLAVTRDGKGGAWTPKGMKVISLDDALKQVAGKPDTSSLEAPMSEAEIDAYFQ